MNIVSGVGGGVFERFIGAAKYIVKKEDLS